MDRKRNRYDSIRLAKTKITLEEIDTDNICTKEVLSMSSPIILPRTVLMFG